ncbi:MAG: 23S rRNA (uridine(2552)-2'-O)-methyltransferase RlmE [Pseudomonadota bacterium]
MAQRSKSSKKWLKEHFTDVFVQQAQKDGFRSRAAYKFLELQEKDQLVKPGMRVADLGAAPGGWSQLVCRYLKGQGQVFALDILPIDPLDGVTIIQGDFREQAVLDQLLSLLDGRQLDLILSDMAPNLSGSKTIDQPRVMYLCELALDFARQALKPQGNLVVKSFHGEGFESYIKTLRQHFSKVIIRKPKASRQRSAECYVLAKGYLNKLSQQAILSNL